MELRQRVDGAYMVGMRPESEAYLFDFARALRVLSAGHAGGEVVGYYHYHRSVLVDGIKEARHSGMSECGVSDDGYCRMLAGVGRAFGHGYGCAHVEACVYGIERGEVAESVAAYVAEHLGRFVFLKHIVERAVHVAVAASLAQCRRTGLGNLRSGLNLCLFEAAKVGEEGLECRMDGVGGQLAGAGKLSRKLAVYLCGAVEQAAQLGLCERLSLLDDEHCLAFVHKLADHLGRERILRHFHYRERASAGERFHKIVVGKAGHDDAETLVGAVGV